MNTSRRNFLAASAFSVGAGLTTPIFATAQTDFQIGYHAITWGDKTEQAIDDIAELGYRGIQIRANLYQKFADRPQEFKALMAAKKLTAVAISTGNVTLNPDTRKQEIEERVAMAKWMKEVGGLYLQATDGARLTQGVNDAGDYQKLGKRLTEIGKRTFGEYGIKLGYHNHMGSLGERVDEYDRIMDAADPKFVWSLPDIAHIHTAGGDPVKFVRHYMTRLVYLHFKDVIVYSSGPANLVGKAPPMKYDFVELGQGKVNIPGVLQILKDYRWSGWIVIELDRAPGGRTPKESAIISKKYLEEKLKLKV